MASLAPNTPVATFISKDAMRRIISDIKEIRANPLTAHGIYYEHDDTDMLKGKALIIGPQGTPYADGFYFFKFHPELKQFAKLFLYNIFKINFIKS
jgi:hypothetical protein